MSPPTRRFRVSIREWSLYEAIVEADDAQHAEEIAEELREFDLDALTFVDGGVEFCEAEPLDDDADEEAHS